MGIGESLKQAYFAVEDQYYAVMDFFDQKIGLPVYKFFVDPIENNGVPSFPFALLLLALATGGAFLLLSPSSVDLSVTVRSAEGVAIQGATVTAFVGGSEFGTQVSSPKGEAVFKGIPIGAKIYFAAEAVGFDPATTKDLTVAADTVVPAIRLSAKPIVPPSYSLSVLVKDAAGNYLEDVSVSISGKNGAELVSLRTNGRGSAALSFSTNDSVVQISAQKDGFDSSSKQVSTSASYTEISLSPKPKAPQEELVPIIVRVRNATDGFVEAKVTLYDSYGGELDSKSTFKTGQVAINVSQGREFTVGAVAIGSDENNYLQFVNRTEMTAAKGMGAVKIVLSRKTPSSTGIIEAKVLDEQADNAGRLLPLKNADVSWFLLGGAPTTTKLGANKTNSDGTAFFELEKSLSTYATAYLSGYLPGVFPFMKAGDKQNVSLKKLAAGNNGAVEVTVKEVDGSAAEGASVKLFYEEGFFAGYPDKRTDADGKVVFPNVSVVGNFHAIATIGSRQGKSSDFSVPISEKPLKVKITLEPTVGTFVVSAKDRYEGTAVSPATVTALISGTKAAGCTIAAGEDACEVVVQSNVDVELVVNATGYVSYSSGFVQVGTDDSKAFEAKLLPERFNTLGIFFDGLKNPAGSAVTAIDKASYYDAVFTVNFPANASNAAGGFYVRVGKVGVDRADADSEEQKFVITGFESVGTQPQKSTSFGSSCDNDLLKSESDNGWYRFVQYNFQPQGTAKMFSGSRQYAIRVFSKPSAFAGERMQLDYRAFLVINNESYVRDPVDADLGDEEKTESKDSCLAETNNAKFDVVDGGLECNDKACIGISFADGTRNYGNYYQTTVDSIFSTNFTVKLLLPISNPVVKISSPGKHAKFYAYSAQGTSNASGNADGAFDLQIAVPISENANGGIVSKAVLPASPTEVLVELYDGPNKVIEKTGILSIQGTGKLTVTASPKKIGAGNETLLKVTVVATESKKPITLEQAGEVWIVQDPETQPFGQDFSATVGAGSIEDDFAQGTDGEYFFSLTPIKRGDFQVVAKAEGFAEASDSVKVLASQVLEVSPLDLEGCVAREEIKLRNLLNLNATVTVSTSDCAKLTNKDNVQPSYAYPSFTFTLGPQAAPYSYYLEPINYNTTCPIDVAARATDGSYSYSRVFYKTCDKDAQGKFLKATPSELKNAAPECDSARTLTLSNNATELVQAGQVVDVYVEADGLDLQKGCGSNGGNLATPIKISQTPGGSCPLSFKPNAAGKEKNISITFKSTLLGGFSDSVQVTFSNCAKPPACPSDAALPEIVSTSPTGTINTLYADLSIRTSESSTCHFDYDANVEYKDMQFDTDGLLTKTHSKKFVPDSSRAFQEGSNTLYANCVNCNGKEMVDPQTISFTYAKPAQPPQCPGAPGCPSGGDQTVSVGGDTTTPPVAAGSVPDGGACTKPEDCQAGLECKDGKCQKPAEQPAQPPADNTITFTFNDAGINITQGGQLIPENKITLNVSSLVPRTGVKVKFVNDRGSDVQVDVAPAAIDCFNLYDMAGEEYSKENAPTTWKLAKKGADGFEKEGAIIFGKGAKLAACYKEKEGAKPYYLNKDTGALSLSDPIDPKFNVNPQLAGKPPAALTIVLKKIDSDAFTLMRVPYRTTQDELLLVGEGANVNPLANDEANTLWLHAGKSSWPNHDLLMAQNILSADLTVSVNLLEKQGEESVHLRSLGKAEGSIKYSISKPVIKHANGEASEYDNNYNVQVQAEAKPDDVNFNALEFKGKPLSTASAALGGAENRAKIKEKLQAALEQAKTMKATGVSGSKLAGIDARDVYVATLEGGVPRILKFVVKDDFTVEEAKEITSDYEFRESKGYVPGSYLPDVVMFSAPGQKWSTAFSSASDCKSGGKNGYKLAASDDKKEDPSACFNIKVRGFEEACGDSAEEDLKDNCLSAKDDANEKKTDGFCNFARGEIENNPRLCCASGLSRNGQCVDTFTSDKCFLSAGGEVAFVPLSASKPEQVFRTGAKYLANLAYGEVGTFASLSLNAVPRREDFNSCSALGSAEEKECNECFVGKKCEDSGKENAACAGYNYVGSPNEPGKGKDRKPLQLLNVKSRCVYNYEYSNYCASCANLRFTTAVGDIGYSEFALRDFLVCGKVHTLLGTTDTCTKTSTLNLGEAQYQDIVRECTPSGEYASDAKLSISTLEGEWTCSSYSFSDCENNAAGRSGGNGIVITNLAKGDAVKTDDCITTGGAFSGSASLGKCDNADEIMKKCFRLGNSELGHYISAYKEVTGADYCKKAQ